jgi:uncharacterized YigZ family protein
MDKDSYLTIDSASEGLYRDKGSKFLAFAFPVNDEGEIRERLGSLKKQYHDARHYCYAWMLGASMDRFRANDDGEPYNSAGKPILSQIKSFRLTNILVVVIRYFGGTLLGVGGLIKAYKTASNEALQNAIIIEKHVHHVYTVKFYYSEMSLVMKVIKEMKLEPFDQIYEMNCEFKVNVPSSLTGKFTNKFRLNPNVKIEFSNSV